MPSTSSSSGTSGWPHVVPFIGDQEDDDLEGVLIASTGLAIRLEDWCRTNCRGSWRIGWTHGYFREARDAALFRLWWG